MNLSELKQKPIGELLDIAKELGLENLARTRKQDVIFSILKRAAKNGSDIYGDGVLEILPPEGLQEKEAYLLELLSQGDGDIETICNQLALDSIEEAPDDIAIMTVSKGQ